MAGRPGAPSPPPLGDRASAEGTARFAARVGLPDGALRPLGRTGLVVTALGFGGYRVADGVPNHEAALRDALRAGVNLVDTSSNYSAGGSERLVGAALRAAIAAGDVRRDEIVVVSKVGYVQGEALLEMRAREGDGGVRGEVVRFADDAWHCIHPRFVHAELDRAIGRTGLAHVDLYLLHNPEYFFTDAVARAGGPAGVDVDALRAIFVDRVRRAFEALEERVAAGVIGAYGVSSNTLGGAADEPTTVSLGALLRAADAAAEAVHGDGRPSAFCAVQLPFNVLEQEAARLGNSPVVGSEGPLVPVIEAARRAGLAVLANRPLNAIRTIRGGQRLVRLAVRPVPPGCDPEALVERAVLRFAAAERSLEGVARRHAPGLSLPLSSPWLVRSWRGIESREDRSAAFERLLLPRAGDAVRLARAEVPADDRDALDAVVGRIEVALRRCAAALDLRADARAAATLMPMERELDAGLPERVRSEPLARKALWFVASTPGVTCALNGMRRPEYVADARAVLALLQRRP